MFLEYREGMFFDDIEIIDERGDVVGILGGTISLGRGKSLSRKYRDG